ncbi:MAG: hypothetical protein IJ228_01670 [Succinivibrio sp.]|nr:hypothetical protein [Succinivibrio sp.]
MDELCPGLYEQVINRELSAKLKELSEKLFRREGIDEAEAPAILSEYAAAVIQKSLELLGAQTGQHPAVGGDADPQNAPRPALSAQIRLINAIVQLLGSSCCNDEYFQQQQVDDRGEQLLSVYAENDARILDPGFTDYERPQTSLRWSTLFTGYEHGIRLDGELRREIRSADSVDLLISFIKYSGLRLIYEDLKAFTDQPGKKLRVVTTTYVNSRNSDTNSFNYLCRLAAGSGLRTRFLPRSTVGL